MGEAFITRRGGTGSGLVLKIVGGTTQPAAPKNNTIWVNTATAITSYALQHDAPADPAAGMVWIQTSYFSFAEMDVDKKHDVKVYPIAAFQYIGGEWVDKEAKSYINGQWKDWVAYVWNGESDISHWVRATSSETGTWYYTDDGFLYTKGTSSSGLRLAYDVPVDLTNIASVRYYGYMPSGETGTNRFVSVCPESSGISGADAAALTLPLPWAKTDPLNYADIDVSTLVGNHYVRIGKGGPYGSNNVVLYIKRIVLIPIGGNI